MLKIPQSPNEIYLKSFYLNMKNETTSTGEKERRRSEGEGAGGGITDIRTYMFC